MVLPIKSECDGRNNTRVDNKRENLIGNLWTFVLLGKFEPRGTH